MTGEKRSVCLTLSEIFDMLLNLYRPNRLYKLKFLSLDLIIPTMKKIIFVSLFLLYAFSGCKKDEESGKLSGTVTINNDLGGNQNKIGRASCRERV